MSLVEHLEESHWQQMLDGATAAALGALSKDPCRTLGSSADDMRAWLSSGGVSRVRAVLKEQMAGRRIDAQRQAEVLARWAALVREHGATLLTLAADGNIPAAPEDVVGFVGWKPEELATMLARLRAGDRPFETWMRESGRSDDDIAAMYASVDRFLERAGLPVAPPWKPS